MSRATKVTANAYFLCDRHAKAWADGGNDVVMRDITDEDRDEFEGSILACADCETDEDEEA